MNELTNGTEIPAEPSDEVLDGALDGIEPEGEIEPATLDPEDLPGTTIPNSAYELVVVAAREARRLNERLRRLVDEKNDKVTTRAIDRVHAGQVRFAYEEEAPGG